MRLELFTPVTAGQSATCRVYGNNETGYIMVKVNGTYRNALPDAHPGVPGRQRLVFGPIPGRGHDVWTDPPWQTGDQLDFELYQSNGTLDDTKSTTAL
jgi:hypothetical protein